MKNLGMKNFGLSRNNCLWKLTRNSNVNHRIELICPIQLRVVESCPSDPTPA